MKDAVRELIQLVIHEHPQIDVASLVRLVLEREDAAPTILAPGIAAPHAIVEDEVPTSVAIGVSKDGINWEGPESADPVHLVVLLVGSRSAHLTVLSQIAARLRDRAVYDAVVAAERSVDICRAIVPEEQPIQTDRSGGHRNDSDVLLIRHALRLQEEIEAAVVVVHADKILDERVFDEIDVGRGVIFVSTTQEQAAPRRKEIASVVIPVHGGHGEKHQRFVLLHLYSHGFLAPYRNVINVTGHHPSGRLDSIRVIDVDATFGVENGLQRLSLPTDLDRSVFARVLQLAEDLALEGREGKPVGALFVVGDYVNVVEKTRQLIVNPFRGYPENQRSILDPTLDETVKEFAKIDGAFLIRGDGVIASAGTFLAGQPQSADHHSGLGARHAAAQGITAVTNAIAIVISESTRNVSVFHRGSRILIS